MLNITRVLLLAAFAFGTTAFAQDRVDVAVTYTAERANVTGNCGCFWLQGGSVEAGATLWHGLGAAANFTGTHNSGMGPQGVALGLVTATFGPRYRYTFPHGPAKLKTVSLFGEGLFGVVHGFDSIFPAAAGPSSSQSALAIQFGGGVDAAVSPHFAIRPIAASWVHTQLPNSTNNAQNDLRLGAGLVFRFGGSAK